MKNIISIFFAFICVVSFTVNTSEAYMGLGSVYDPIHVQIEQSPLEKLRIERQEVQTLRSSLQAKYGATEYYACYDYSPCTKNDLSFPGASKMCEYQIQSCLSRGLLKPTEFQKARNAYLSDKDCKSKYGNTSEWNEVSQKCLDVAPTKSNDQVCSESYANSKWNGAKNDKGGLVCDCNLGFTWNSMGTQCISNQGVKQKVSSNTAPTCSISFNPKTVQIGQATVMTYTTSGLIENVTRGINGWDKNTSFVSNLNTGKYSYSIKTDKLGKNSDTITVIGPGGSSTCSGFYTVTTKKSTDAKAQIESKISEIIQAPSVEPVVVSESATPKNIGLFNRILNWFK